MTLKRQNRIYFQISGAGHEAVQVAAGMALRSGHDWVYPYYRDRALCLTLGVTPREMLQQAVGAAADPASGGRQMPSHWGHRKYHVVSSSSPTGTQFLQAVGCAEASRYKDPKSDEVTLVCAGDGATSEGEFWEALNVASLARLPVLFLIEDNGYAISVPIEAQTAGGSISALTASFPGLFRQEVDGTDFFASYRAMRDAVQYCREGRGPALVHARVIRPYSHSLSDDERAYRTAAEREAESARDPVLLFPKLLIEEGVMDRRMLQNITHEIDEEVQQATQEAMRDDPPAAASALTHLYSDKVDATSAVVRREAALRGCADDHGGFDQRRAARGDAAQSRYSGVRRGRGGLHARSEPERGERQGRRVQGDARFADGIRFTPRFQYAAGGGGDCGACDRDGDARTQAGGGDSVLRLHLAGDDATAR